MIYIMNYAQCTFDNTFLWLDDNLDLKFKIVHNFFIYQPISKIRKSKQVRFAPESVWCDFFFTGDINKLNTSNRAKRIKVEKIPKFGNLNLTVLTKEAKIENGYFCSWKIRHQWDYRKKIYQKS